MLYCCTLVSVCIYLFFCIISTVGLCHQTQTTSYYYYQIAKIFATITPSRVKTHFPPIVSYLFSEGLVLMILDGPMLRFLGVRCLSAADMQINSKRIADFWAHYELL